MSLSDLNPKASLLPHALAYAELGWPVFPVWPMRGDACGCDSHPTCDGGRNAGKHPINRLVPNGHLNATTDAETIRRWWSAHPDANIGLHCAGADVVVVDGDPRNGGDKSWALLDLPDSPLVADTGGAGFHQFYAAPNGDWHGRKYPGIDIKYNGYVVLPPSNHRSGNTYRWRSDPASILSLVGLPPLPECFVDDMSFQSGGTYLDEPLGDLSDDDVDHWLSCLADNRWGYESWVNIGSALHHQYRGSAHGLAIWEAHSKQRPGYKKNTDTAEKWRSFGKNSRIRPTTFRTVIEWARDDARDRLIDSLDEVDEFGAEECGSSSHEVGEAGKVPPSFGNEEQGMGSPPFPALDLSDLIGFDPPQAADDIDAIDDAPSSPRPCADWMSLLQTTAKGDGWANHLHNIELIMANDPRLAGLPRLNEFTQETVQRTPPGHKPPRRANSAKPTRQLEGRIWQVSDPVNGDLWSDDRDFAIRSIIEAPRSQGGYGIKVTDRDLKAAVTLAANNNPFHPVREYLDALQWDGTPRAESLFVDYLGAEDNAYARGIARLMLLGAVVRIFEPGHKFDFCVILEGLQGRRKSTFIRILGRSWFAELDGDFHDQRVMIELMQGAWILEIPELSGFSRADVKAIKAFMSREKDRARLAYARRAGEFPRQCIFIGSTNDQQYLRDDTGARRFWPMPCSVDSIDTDRLGREIDQIWAEVVGLYRSMRAVQPGGTLPLHLSGEALRIAEFLQEERREENEADGLAGEIADWLDKPINDGGFDDVEPGAVPKLRDAVCLRQIWIEGLGGDRRQYTYGQARTLGRAMLKVRGWKQKGKRNFPGYTDQKAWVREETLIALAGE